MSLHDERVNYETIRLWVLDTYYRGCRENAIGNGWLHEQILGYVSYQFETSFERQVEKLMFNVVLLILSGGWHKGPEKILRDSVDKIIGEIGLNGVLLELPEDEAEAFLQDLKALKIA